MIEPEHTKVIALTIAAGVSWFSGTIADTIGPDIASKWIERGGTALAVALLIIAVRTLRADGKELRAKLDANSERDKTLLEKATESRIELNNTLKAIQDTIKNK